ncbi:hypothetical protein J6590_042141 [Homalodisca vitripennis]|nr:hypothetical protein J6590_042141 [Homalodisca vitripennis]
MTPLCRGLVFLNGREEVQNDEYPGRSCTSTTTKTSKEWTNRPILAVDDIVINKELKVNSLYRSPDIFTDAHYRLLSPTPSQPYRHIFLDKRSLSLEPHPLYNCKLFYLCRLVMQRIRLNKRALYNRQWTILESSVQSEMDCILESSVQSTMDYILDSVQSAIDDTREFCTWTILESSVQSAMDDTVELCTIGNGRTVELCTIGNGRPRTILESSVRSAMGESSAQSAIVVIGILKGPVSRLQKVVPGEKAATLEWKSSKQHSTPITFYLFSMYTWGGEGEEEGRLQGLVVVFVLLQSRTEAGRFNGIRF